MWLSGQVQTSALRGTIANYRGTIPAHSLSCPPSPPSKGDAVTKSWLESNLHRVFGFPSLVRFSWATCTPLLEAAAAVPVAWECEADDGAEGQQTLGWRAGAKRKAAGPRHAFFHMRRLALVGGETFVRGASLHA